MTKLHNSGGARPGAGRKSIWSEPTRSMRLPVDMASNIQMMGNAPESSMVIWWTTQQDCERSQGLIETDHEIADLFNNRCGRPGRGRVWSDIHMKIVEPPQSKEDIGGILMSVETAKQICHLPGIWQLIPKAWVAN